MGLADPNCPRCHGAGYLVVGRAAGGRCPCTAPSLSRLDAIRRLRAAGLPAKYAKATVDGFHLHETKLVPLRRGVSATRLLDQRVVDAQNQAQVRRLAATRLPPGGFVFFIGPHGCGKTYLAAALLRAQVENFEQTGFYITAKRYVTQVLPDGAPPGEQRDLRTRVLRADVLLLDDLGVERPSYFVMRELLDVVDERSAEERVTIVTSNLTPSAALRLDRTIGTGPGADDERRALEVAQRIFSRIRERRFVVRWPDGMDDYRETLYQIGRVESSGLDPEVA